LWIGDAYALKRERTEGQGWGFSRRSLFSFVALLNQGYPCLNYALFTFYPHKPDQQVYTMQKFCRRCINGTQFVLVESFITLL
jgi:hypothetical protein